MNIEVDIYFSRQEIMDIAYEEAEELGIDPAEYPELFATLVIDTTLNYTVQWLHERGHEEISDDLDFITSDPYELVEDEDEADD